MKNIFYLTAALLASLFGAAEVSADQLFTVLPVKVNDENCISDFKKLSKITPGSPEVSEIKTTLNNGCESGSKKCCTTLGSLYADGYLSTQLIDDALKAWQKGCALDDSESCAFLSDYYNGRFKSKNIDADIARTYMDKALKLAKKGCKELKSEECTVYGSLLLFSSDRKDFQRAIESSLTKACLADNAEGCFYLGVKYARFEQQDDKGFKYFKKACALGESMACSVLSLTYMHGSPNNVIKKDISKAVEYGTKSCDMNDVKGCIILSKIFSKDLANEAEERKFLSKACNLGDKKSCRKLQQN